MSQLEKRQAGIEVEAEMPPEMIEIVGARLEDDRGIIEEGGTGDLHDLVAKVLRVHRADKNRTAYTKER